MNNKQSLKELLSEVMAETLQHTVSKLGPMPNEAGARVKQLLSECHSIKMLFLGTYLQDCYEQSSYDPLEKGLKEMGLDGPDLSDSLD